MTRFVSKIATIHIFLLFITSFSGRVESLGINYGQVGNNLLPPVEVITLLNSLKITKSRIYDTNPQVLTAFANSNIELIVTVENDMLGTLMDPGQAFQWVKTHIKPYFPATKISGIAVGNEVISDEGDLSLVANVVPAMINIHNALYQLGFDPYIHVSTPCSLGVLSESYPPSAGNFKPELSNFMLNFLNFLNSTKSPFWINAYPYFAYKDDPTHISLDYVLMNPNLGMVDPYTKLHYDNMLYAQVDAITFAMARLGFGGIEVRVSETGWPSKGDNNEIGATFENAAIYNKNLLRRQFSSEGTPLRPKFKLEIYLFALFNENMKPGPTSERNYGLFQPDGIMSYNVGNYALSSISSTSTTSISLTSSNSWKLSPKSFVQWMYLCIMIFKFCMRKPCNLNQ